MIPSNSPESASVPDASTNVDDSAISAWRSIRRLQDENVGSSLERLEQLERALDELRIIVQEEVSATLRTIFDKEKADSAIDPKVSKLIGRIAKKCRIPFAQHTGILEEHAESSLLRQRELFSRLNALIGNSATKRKEAEMILNEYVGIPATKDFVDQLKKFLKSRKWGIVSQSGVAAAPLWQPDAGRPAGGYMRLSFTHPETGVGTNAESFSKLQNVNLVDRPFQRRAQKCTIPIAHQHNAISKENAESDSVIRQRELFSRLDALVGNGEAERNKAQDILNEYVGIPATENFVDQLKKFLKDRNWGIQSASGVAAAPVWQADAGRPAGGYMRLSYTDPESGIGTKSESYSRLKNLILVDRPDRRRKNTK